MSNTLAVAAVTSTLRHVVEQALGGPQPGPVGSATVTTLHPSRLVVGDDGVPPKGINLFLYRVTPNHAWNLTDLPTRSSTGALVRRPVAALDLHYLVSCTGDDTELDAQRLLARAVLAFAVSPVLGRDLVAEALAEYAEDTPTAFLSAADLADAVELVKISPDTLSLEDLSRLWGALGTPYALSVTYLATVVLIEADLAPRPPLPVRERVVGVAPIAPPILTDVATDPPGSAVAAGSTLTLRGSGLLAPATVPGSTTTIRFGPVELAPADGATAAALTVELGEAVPAGVHALHVVHRSAPGPGGAPPSRVTARSNAVPVLVRPDVSAIGVTPSELRLTISPPLFAGQRATVTLTPLGGANDPAPLSFTLAPVPASGEPSPSVVLDREPIADGDWLVRLLVDGADSLPHLDGETYGEPLLRLP